YQGGKVSLSGGSDDTRNVNVSYGGGDAKFNYFINAGTEHTDGYIDNADRKSNYFSTKLDWRIKDNATLTFAGSYSNTDKGSLNPVDLAGRPLWYTTGFWKGLNDWQVRDWKQTNLSLTYAEKASDNFDYNIKIYRFTEENGLWADGRNYNSSIATANSNGIVPGSLKNGVANDVGYSTLRWNVSYWDSTLEGIELQGNLKLDKENTLTFGSLYNDMDWKKSVSNHPLNNYPNSGDLADPFNPDPSTYHWSTYNNKRYGYYLQDNYTPNEKTTITFGLRYDKNEVTDGPNDKDKSESATNPTVNVVYQLDNHNTLRASYGETISFPTVSQLYGTNGNSDLKPETAKNYELGWKHQFDESLTGDIAIFKNDVKNMIDKSTISDVTLYRNNLRAKFQGIELELNKKFTDRCNGFFNYTYLDTSVVRAIGGGSGVDSTLVTMDQKYTPNHNINYGLTYRADKGYKFSLTGHLVTSRATWDDGTGDSRTDKTPINTIGGYHVMDLQIKRDMNKDQDWYINVFNVFDRDYRDELFFPAAGRTVIVGLDFKF
ncbi:MAG: TonB-dependent receptor, partial [Bacillota bacterium]